MSQQAALLARFPFLAKVNSWPKPLQLGAASAVVAVIVMLLLWTRSPDYRVLFSNLADRDGGAIVTALNQMNVPYRFSENGGAILIPSNKVYETRLQLAEQGLPRAGDTGFELLDKTRFGASQFTEQVNYQRALEGELTHSVEAMQSVQSARVHLAIPRESLFVRDRQPPTASVLLTLYPGRSLSESQVSAITWLVSSSVPNLGADKVSVVDQNGRLLTPPTGEAAAESGRRSFALEVEQRAVERIMNLLTPLVGAGNVRAQVSADIDFSQRELTSEVYRPNQTPGEAAIRSQQTSASVQNNVLAPEGIPGALTNQPPLNPVAPIITPPAVAANPAQPAQGVNAAPDAANAAAATILTAPADPLNGGSGTSRNDATINYEVDRTISHIKDPLAKVKRLSAAVVINSHVIDDTPDAQDNAQLEKINELVKQAMGYSAERGDTLSVINSPFTSTVADTLPVWKNPLYLDYAAQLGKYLLIALGLLLLWRKIIKPLMESLIPVPEVPTPESPKVQFDREQIADAERRASELSRYEDNLTTARTMAEKDPRAVAMVLRSWMEKDGNR
ncbi:MAG: flagellar M-ring protein FliF [Burkholderiaceae bacterium]|nr:flagellar M-ring protein FliF [Burkholderiaceae bacterium]